MRRDAPRAPAWLVAWLAAATVALAALAPFAALGFAAFVRGPAAAASSARPAFSRPMQANCGEAFYCMNNTDVNPSYIALYTAPPDPPISFLPAFLADSAFDVSDVHGTTVRVAGLYSLVAFVPIITFDESADVAIMLTKDPGVLLATPVLSGDLSNVHGFNITQFPTHASQAAAIVHLDAGDTVRVGYVVSAPNVLVTPGAYLAGFLVQADA